MIWNPATDSVSSADIRYAKPTAYLYIYLGMAW